MFLLAKIPTDDCKVNYSMIIKQQSTHTNKLQLHPSN